MKIRQVGLSEGVVGKQPQAVGRQCRYQSIFGYQAMHERHAIRLGQYVAFDAAETLSSFMSGEELDMARCASTFRSMARSAQGTLQHQPFRVVMNGEAVALACAQGRTDLALLLEQLWSDVAATGSMFSICGYPVEPSLVAEPRGVFPEICKEHCAITWPEGSGPSW